MGSCCDGWTRETSAGRGTGFLCAPCTVLSFSWAPAFSSRSCLPVRANRISPTQKGYAQLAPPALVCEEARTRKAWGPGEKVSEGEVTPVCHRGRSARCENTVRWGEVGFRVSGEDSDGCIFTQFRDLGDLLIHGGYVL